MSILTHLMHDKEVVAKRTIIIRGLIGIGIVLLSFLPLSIIVVSLSKYFGVDFKSIIKSYDVAARLFDNYNPIFAGFYIVILGPLYEEIIFRLGLSFKKWHVAISCSVLVFFILNRFTEIPLTICIASAVFVLIIISLFVDKHLEQKMSEKYKMMIVIIYILAFGLIHLINYAFYDYNAIFIYLLMVLPMVGMGAVITYYRINLGFIYGLLLHIGINGLNLLMNSI